MEKSLFDYNIDRYNDTYETEYIFQRGHQLRVLHVIDLINKSGLSKNSSKILSLGCSTGVAEEMIKKGTGMEVYGIDGAKKALIEANKRGIKAVYGDLTEKFPFEDREFDVVYAGELIEHLFDTKKFLLEVNRVLRDGGIFVLTTPNLAKFEDRIKFLFGYAPRHTTPIHPYLNLHIRPFTFKSLKNCLELCGFKVTDLRSNVIDCQLFGKMFKSELLAKYFPTFGSTLIVKAIKI